MHLEAGDEEEEGGGVSGSLLEPMKSAHPMETLSFFFYQKGSGARSRLEPILQTDRRFLTPPVWLNIRKTALSWSQFTAGAASKDIDHLKLKEGGLSYH